MSLQEGRRRGGGRGERGDKQSVSGYFLTTVQTFAYTTQPSSVCEGEGGGRGCTNNAKTLVCLTLGGEGGGRRERCLEN